MFTTDGNKASLKLSIYIYMIFQTYRTLTAFYTYYILFQTFEHRNAKFPFAILRGICIHVFGRFSTNLCTRFLLKRICKFFPVRADTLKWEGIKQLDTSLPCESMSIPLKQDIFDFQRRHSLVRSQYLTKHKTSNQFSLSHELIIMPERTYQAKQYLKQNKKKSPTTCN